MKTVDALIKQLTDDRAYYSRALAARKALNADLRDLPEKHKECVMLLEILYAVRDGRRVVIERGGRR